MRRVTNSFEAIRRAGGFAAVLLLVGTASSAGRPPVQDDLSSVWRLGAETKFHEAEAALPAEDPAEEAIFTRAVLLFNRQPRTDGRMDEAIALFAGLVEKSVKPELRARSLYFWARAADLRQSASSPEAALKLYERLSREYPRESYGQRALVHRLILAFYGDEAREAVLARCAALEREADGLSDNTVRTHFHQVAARGYLHLGGAEAQALKHLLAVEQIGVARREAAGDLMVSIGQLGAELGQPQLAREHYAAFLREFPHDPRTYTVRALLAALPAGEAKAP